MQLDVRELVTWSRRVLDPTAPLDDCVRDDPRVDGELLPGWYDEWVLLERERLRQLRLHVWEALSEKLAASGRYGQAVDAAHEAIRLAPLRESAHRALIRALAAEGNLDEALRAFEQFEARLADELGFAPSVQLEAYVHRLLRLKATTAPGLRPPER